MKLNLIALLIVLCCLYEQAQSATRVGIYTSSDCAEENLTGYILYPYPSFDYNEFYTTKCTPATGGSPAQYYDIVPERPEESPGQRPDWLYYLQGSGSCGTFNANYTVFLAARPNTCLNYQNPFTSEASPTSNLFSSCNASQIASLTFDQEFNCPGIAALQVGTECAVLPEIGVATQVICEAPVVPDVPVAVPEVPVAMPEAPVAVPEAPVAAPEVPVSVVPEMPMSGPSTAGPMFVPMPSTPSKKTSGAVNTIGQLSLAALAGFVAVITL